jgi:hypothetical protein
MSKKKPVLGDHKKQGKVLIPPFTYLVGPLQDVSWISTMIPELCWIALIHEKHGSRHAVELLTTFTRMVRETAPATSHTWLAPCSNVNDSPTPCRQFATRLAEASAWASATRQKSGSG